MLNPKKKVFETVQPELHTNEEGVACYRGIPLMVPGKGVCRAATMRSSGIKWQNIVCNAQQLGALTALAKVYVPSVLLHGQILHIKTAIFLESEDNRVVKGENITLGKV